MTSRVEAVAEILWHRYSPDHEDSWPSPNADEYRRVASDILSTLTTEPAAPQEAPAPTQVGWAYQDKRWDADRWHVCGLEKPREHKGRKVKPIYIAEPAAPEGRQEVMRIGDAVLDWMVKFDLLDAGNEYYVSDVLAVLSDLTPSTRPSEQAVAEAAHAVLQWYERDGSVGGAVEPFEALKAAMEAGRHE